MNDKKYAKQLLELARKDLTALHGMLGDETKFDDAIFGFHAQQTVEKSLKALLSNKEVEFKKTHDLSELFAQIKERGNELPEEFSYLIELTDFAVEYRYDLMLDEEPINRREILEKINKLFELVNELI